MNLLVADEGVDKAIVDALRADGFDIQYFGERVFRQRLASPGVVLIRLAGVATDSKSRMVQQALRDHLADMFGAFTVISPGMVRIRSVVPIAPQ